MTDANEPHEIDGPHEGPIKTPRQLILTVLFAFVVPIFGILLLVTYVTSADRPSAGSDALTAKAIDQRIAPVGIVEVKDASDIASLKTGEQVFAAQCTTCHTPGLLGAPKFGDTAAWAPRIKTGFETLWQAALHGKGQMPPQGGGDFTDFEIARAVVYMADKGGATFPEPKPPAAAASGAAATTEALATPAAPATPAPTVAAPVVSPAPQAVATATTTAAPAPAAATNTPPALFTQVCTACHSTGAAGAPKVGDKAAWAPRIAQGMDTLVATAIKGTGAMPPKGGSKASEAEIRAVVTYMVNASK